MIDLNRINDVFGILGTPIPIGLRIIVEISIIVWIFRRVIEGRNRLFGERRDSASAISWYSARLLTGAVFLVVQQLYKVAQKVTHG